MNRLKLRDFQQATKTPLTLILDDVRSGINVGSVFRTADAFRIREIILCGITPRPPHKEIQKSALGATESVAWSYHKTIQEYLDTLKKGAEIYALEQTHGSIPLQEIKNQAWPEYLIIGNEVHGVSETALNYCKGALEIPQFGTKHSLNVSVSTGMAVWEILKHQLPEK